METTQPMLLRISRDTAVFTSNNSYVKRGKDNQAIIVMNGEDLPSEFLFETFLELYHFKEQAKAQFKADLLAEAIKPAFKQSLLETQQRFEG